MCRNWKMAAQIQIESLVPSDKIHEDFILHHARDLWHPGLRDGSSLSSRHHHLTWDGKKE